MHMVNKRPVALAQLRGDREHMGLRGAVRFYQLPGGILLEAEVMGLPNNGSGFFGFHIHEGADCSGTGFTTAGGHLGGKCAPHPQHAGD